MAVKKTPSSSSIYHKLAADAPTTVSVKLSTGELFRDVQVQFIGTNGIQVLDRNASPALVRYIPESLTAYISVSASF